METEELKYDVVYFAEGSDPLSLMRAFNASASGIKVFVDRLATEVKEGRIDALLVKRFFKTFEKMNELADEQLKPYYNTEAAKYGDKPFEHLGAEFHLTAVKTDYIYAGCNHPRWNGLTEIIDKAIEARKAIEATLKPLKEPFTMIDEDSGEVVTVRPPLKKSIDGIKIKIK